MIIEWIDLWAGAMFRAVWQGGTALLGAWIVCALFRRVSPGVKCWLWRLGYLKFVTALVLVGSIGLPWLPAKQAVSVAGRTDAATTVIERPAAIMDRAAPKMPVATPDKIAAPAVGVGHASSQVAAPDVAVARNGATSELLPAAGVGASARPAMALAPVDTKPKGHASVVLPAIFVLWIMGVVFSGLRVFGIWRRTSRVYRAARPVEDEGILALLERLAGHLGLGKAPQIKVSDEVSGPLLVGIIHPAILIPPGLLEESCGEPLRLALTHELAHVRRRDIFWNLMQTMIEGVFFFHPMIWMARRQPRYWQELACDGMTLSSARTSPTEYGRAILGIIERQRFNPAVLAGVGVAESVKVLKKRLIAMTTLKPTSGRGLFFAVVLVIVLALAGIPSWRLVERSARAAAPAEDPLASGTVTVKVVDDEGKPLEEASVDVRYPNQRPQQQWTGKEGVVIFKQEEGMQWYSIIVNAEGRTPAVMNRQTGDPTDPAPNQVTFKMDKAIMIGGIVVDDAGKAVTDAHVLIRVVKKYPDSLQRVNISFLNADTDGNGKWSFMGVPEEFDDIELGVWSYMHIWKTSYFLMQSYKDAAALKAGNAKLTLPIGTPIHIKIVGDDGAPVAGATVNVGEDGYGANAMPKARSNSDGEVELGFEQGSTAILTVMARGHAPKQQRLAVEQTPLDAKFELAPAAPLTGKVVDAQGNPLRGAMVYIDTWHGTRPFADMRVTSRPDGTFVWNEAPEDEVFADVLLNGFTDQRRVRMKTGEENLVKMTGPTTFSGKVVDATTGKAIDDFNFTIGIDMKNGGGVTWQPQLDRFNGKGKNGAFERSLSESYPGWVVRVEAKGFMPADSESFEADGKRHEFTYKLVKGNPVAGMIVGADGKPVGKATVLLLLPGNTELITNGRPSERPGNTPRTATGADGKFQFDPQKDPYALGVFADEGYAILTKEDFEKSPTITLTQWAKVEGELRVGTKPAAKGKAVVNYPNYQSDDRTNPLTRLYMYNQATADENGKFVIDRVMAKKATTAMQVELSDHYTSYANGQDITPKPGETLHVKLGGTGRPVIGNVEIPEELKKEGFVIGFNSLRTKVELPKMADPPAEIANGKAEDVNQWTEQWLKSDEGKAYQAAREKARSMSKSYPVVMKMDGKFRADDVGAGTYELLILLNDLPSDGSRYSNKIAATGAVDFTVPEIPGGVSDEPMTLEPIKLQVRPHLKSGDLAPNFTVKTLDGKELKLEDFRGKYVVLDFRVIRNANGNSENPTLKSIWAAYGANPKFAMIGLSQSRDAQTIADYVKKEGMTWPQGFLGLSNEVMEQYAVDTVPSIWLIGPDGKIVAKEAQVDRLSGMIKNLIKP